MQAQKLSSKRRNRCLGCHRLFEPDPRTKEKQKYCSRQSCQRERQRKNERDWRRQNPECLLRQYERTRLWNKAHPEYSRQRRTKYPKLQQANREQTRERMRKIRQTRQFDKSKAILAQLTGIQADKCYLTRGRRWIYIRLTKASPLSKAGFLRDNNRNVKQVINRMPKGRLYDLSEEIFNQHRSGP